VTARDGFVVVRILRLRVGDEVYDSATEASEAAGRLFAKTGHEHGIAHVSLPLDQQ
jgi:hypothetical protein